MRTILGVYATVYAILAIITIVDDLRSGNPLWETASDVILLVLGLMGIIFYWLGVPHPDLRAAWRVVALIIVAGQVATNLLGRFLWRKRTDREQENAVRFADIVTTLLLTPMFVANLAYAFM